ncbi:MAG: EamA family transporter [Candidatus Accumulibacter sp.]|nr:EamA family transporter [Accumulibacter sp.]MBA4094383.1 EamA family transporter [Accumulibacter sp.]MBN9423170.1 EamA family transporter [Accumulibacter sp.]OJW52335.1 MAG: multidrug DMT transporter permease [Candidatus Accumulibacter sp. 66-26]
MSSTHDRLPRQGLFLLAALALGWGLNWPIMKVALAELPPLYFRGSCLFLGGLGMLAIARAGGSIAVPRERWGRLLIVSLFNIVGWNVLLVYGVLLLPSGRAALLGYTMPVWSVLLSVWLLGERLTGPRLIGLVLGFAGVLVLMGGSLGGMLQAPVGVICMIAAAWSWALGVVLLKRLPVGLSTTALTGWMMLLGSLPMLAAAIPLETSRLVVPSFWPAFGLVYSVFIAFMFCYWAWNRIVLMVPVAVSSLSSLVTPLIGVLGGAIFLGEQPGWREGLAALLILAAVGVVSLKRTG